jgi:hypothetical protein
VIVYTRLMGKSLTKRASPLIEWSGKRLRVSLRQHGRKRKNSSGERSSPARLHPYPREAFHCRRRLRCGALCFETKSGVSFKMKQRCGAIRSMFTRGRCGAATLDREDAIECCHNARRVGSVLAAYDTQVGERVSEDVTANR